MVAVGGGCGTRRVVGAAGILPRMVIAGGLGPGGALRVSSLPCRPLQGLFDGRIPQTLGQQLFLGLDGREKRGQASGRDGGLLRQLPPALLQLRGRQQQLGFRTPAAEMR